MHRKQEYTASTTLVQFRSVSISALAWVFTMPQIRVMNWNVEKLSYTKSQIAGMAQAIADVVVSGTVDIAILLELRHVAVGAVLTAVTNAINARPGGASYWLRSESIGGEHYGFIVRDVAAIRPVVMGPPAAGATPLGTSTNPLTNLLDPVCGWHTWPVRFPTAWTAGVPLPAPPLFPLCDQFATRTLARNAAGRLTFGGRPATLRGLPAAIGGYAPGRGSRMPCLAMFVVAGPLGLYYLLPIVVCHYGAVRSGRNQLAQAQISQLRYMHASQLFSYVNPGGIFAAPAAPVAGYLTIDGGSVPVQNLMFTGDFNVDFLTNSSVAGAPSPSNANAAALRNMTPTQQRGGSVTPAAAAGQLPAPPAGPLPPPAPLPLALPLIGNQALRASTTSEGTMLQPIPPPPITLPAAATTSTLRGAAFDYFLYGGPQLNSAVVPMAAPQDSGIVIDVPSLLSAPGAGGIDLTGAQQYYTGTGTKSASQAPNLSTVGANLTLADRWIGARLISDHLPVVLEFTC
jgi:hypothetical protein